MCTEDFIIELFCRVDGMMPHLAKHPQGKLWPSEVVTIAMLFAIKGVGERQFYRWLARDWRHLFPDLPERTRLFRLMKRHADLTERFLAEPTVLGVADTYGIELLHPAREGYTPRQLGRKGISNKRWIVGGKLGVVLNRLGLICHWEAATANVSDIHFRPMVARFAQRMVVLTDSGFHGSDADPPNMKVCQKKRWNVRILVETVLAMLTAVCHLKKMRHRAWAYFRARLAYTVAAFNLLVQWHGLRPDERGIVHLSIAEFSL